MQSKQILNDLKELVVSKVREIKYGTEILSIVLIVAFVGAGLWGYRYYRVSREQTAQKNFAAVLEEYEQISRMENPDLQDIEQLFQLGYEQNSGTVVAPSFLNVKANVLLEQGKKVEAAQEIEKALNVTGKKSPLYNLYKMKHGIILLDMEDEESQILGLAALQELSQDESNLNRDIARFYIGYYYVARGEFDKAREEWQLLIDEQDAGKDVSPWAKRAEKMLDSIA